MINQDKWISSLPKINMGFSKTTIQLDHDKWINTIPKSNAYNSVKKYSLTVVLFVCALLFVSVVKNETRNLQKEINNLKASINVIKFNLDQAILDNEVITSPGNISLLAKEYLNADLVFYKRSQIKHLNDETKKFSTINKIKKEKINEKKVTKLPFSIKSQIAKKIEHKGTEIRKIQDIYYNPKSIPGEIKTGIVKKIKKTKLELKNIYHSPKDAITLEKVKKWGVVQVVKVFLGVPIVPGK